MCLHFVQLSTNHLIFKLPDWIILFNNEVITTAPFLETWYLLFNRSIIFLPSTVPFLSPQPLQTPLPSGFLQVKLVTFLLPHEPQPVHDYDITHRFVSFTYSQPHPLCNNTIRTRLTTLPHFQHQIPPVFKSGHKNVVTNYRGVALPILSKVLERSVQSRILNLIGPHLSPSQHGFRKNRSGLC